MNKQENSPKKRVSPVATGCTAGGVDMQHYLSFGGGVNSVALYLLMEQLGMEFEAIFIDHDGDWPETYEYVDYFIASGRPVTVLKAGCYRKNQDRTYDDLFEYCWEMEMVPSTMARWCTKDFKVKPVNRYVKKPCWMHLGIDAGEQKRARINAAKGIESRWLLIEHDIDRQGCKDLIAKAGLKVPRKSGCFFCPFQRIAQWRELRMKHPELFCKAQKLENRNMAARAKKGKVPLSLRNDGRTLGKIVNAAPNLWPEMNYPPCQCRL